MRLTLASASPRRSQLLRAAGYDITVQAVDVDEQALAGESVAAMVNRLARLKCLACPEQQRPVLAADTMVSLHDQPLGKPAELNQAKAMLQALSAHTHQVLTAVCIRQGERLVEATACTEVTFFPLDTQEIDAYLRHHDVLDKAGGYAIQEGAASFISRIDGPLDNVIGLPLRTTRHLLQQLK